MTQKMWATSGRMLVLRASRMEGQQHLATPPQLLWQTGLVSLHSVICKVCVNKVAHPEHCWPLDE